MLTSDSSDEAVEVCRSLLFLVQHCPHCGPGSLLPLLRPLSYTVQMSLLDNNQCRMDESNQAAHAMVEIQTLNPLITGNLCWHMATASWRTEFFQPTYPCRDGDTNPRPSFFFFFFFGVPQRLDAWDLGRHTRYCYLESIYHTWDGGTGHRASLMSLPTQCTAVLGGLHWVGVSVYIIRYSESAIFISCAHYVDQHHSLVTKNLMLKVLYTLVCIYRTYFLLDFIFSSKSRFFPSLSFSTRWMLLVPPLTNTTNG